MQELSWAEKYAIRLLFGKIPAVSTDDAMNDFLRSEQLHSGKSKGNLLYLAKVCMQIDRFFIYLFIS